MTVSEQDLDAVCVNTIRGLCMDTIDRASSGHPGTPLGMAPVAYTLWQPRRAVRGVTCRRGSG
jgi:transketolase